MGTKWAIYSQRLGWLEDTSHRWNWDYLFCEEFDSRLRAEEAITEMARNGHSDVVTDGMQGLLHIVRIK